MLLSGDGLGTSAIMAATGKSKTCVWRWQKRFMHEGVEGLLCDKSRPPGKAPIPPARVAEIARLTHEPPPHEATHWTVRAMAKVALSFETWFECSYIIGHYDTPQTRGET